MPSPRTPPTPATPLTRTTGDKPLFVTWKDGDEAGKASAYRESARGLDRVWGLIDRESHRTVGTNVYQNIAPNNTSVRDGFDKRDYDYFRPGEASPRTQRDIIAACMQAYDKVGIVRNVIDMMGDFATQGIELVHPNPRIEQWYKHWFVKIGGRERTERFCNTFCRAGNAVIKRHTAKLTIKQVDEVQKGIAKPDIKVDPPPDVEQREIPWKYVILNPLQIDVIGGDLAPFIGQTGFSYALRLPDSIIRKIKHPNNDVERQLIKGLPNKIRQGIKDGNRSVALDDDKLSVFYYKKDDWQVWANPFCYGVLDQLITLKKLELADRVALDGALSHIRLWKLGSLADRILPTEAAVNRLSNLLLNSSGNGGVLDLIWGPELSIEETSTDIAKFLGPEKYSPTLTSIYAGLGIPPTMTGAATQGGFTNNFISLQTLIERIQYVRDTVTTFWMQEIRLVQKAMGFRFPAQVVFDRMKLTDEAAELALFIQLVDRNIISEETVIRRFGQNPELERVRMRRESRMRKSQRMPEKTSPFHNPEQEKALEKIFAQSGAYSPSQFGIELEEPKKGEKPPLKVQPPKAAPTALPSSLPDKGGPRSGPGRPINSKDTNNRKQKTVKPRKSVKGETLDALLWSEAALKTVADLTTPIFLQSLKKKNLRQLTVAEAADFEEFKFGILCNLPFQVELTEGIVFETVSKPLSLPAPLNELYKATLDKYVEKNKMQPTTDWLRQIQAKVCALWKTEITE